MYSEQLLELNGIDPRKKVEFVKSLSEECYEDFMRFIHKEDNRVTYESKCVGNFDYDQALQMSHECLSIFDIFKPAPSMNEVDPFIPLSEFKSNITCNINQLIPAKNSENP